MNTQPTKSKRGFASLTPERMKEVASSGGKAAHSTGRAHQFTSAEAREAGRKGGLARAANRAAKVAQAQGEQ